MIWLISWLSIVLAGQNGYYDYAQEEVMSQKTRDILNERMWAFDYTKIPNATARDSFAMMYVQIKKGAVYNNCFGICNGYFKQLASLIYDSQKELETCLPDTSFWHFNGDFIIDVKPEVHDQNP